MNSTLINATIGLSVLLPCLVPPPPPPLADTRIYWQTLEDNSENNPLVLHFYNWGTEEQDHTADKYKNRTALDLSQLPYGNFSLELRNVTKADNQTTIRCLYSRGRKIPEEIKRITLLVLDKTEEPDLEVPFRAPTRLTLPILIPLIALLFICCGLIMCRVVQQKRTGCMAMTETEASHEEGADLRHVTVNGAANGEEDKEQQSQIPLRNDIG